MRRPWVEEIEGHIAAISAVISQICSLDGRFALFKSWMGNVESFEMCGYVWMIGCNKKSIHLLRFAMGELKAGTIDLLSIGVQLEEV